MRTGIGTGGLAADGSLAPEGRGVRVSKFQVIHLLERLCARLRGDDDDDWT